jgi:hypothetical protein
MLEVGVKRAKRSEEPVSLLILYFQSIAAKHNDWTYLALNPME